MAYTAAHWGAYRVTDNGLHPIEDDPVPAPAAEGWLEAAQDRRTRILAPAVREGWLNGEGGANRCRDRYISVSWDRAAELVADELTRVRRDHGNQAIFAGSYGWASAGRFHHAQSHLRRFLNLIGGFTFSRETYSHAAAEVLLPFITGISNHAFQDKMTSWPLVSEHCTLLVAFGGVSSRSAQIASGGCARHMQAEWLRGIDRMTRVNISPQSSDFADAPGAEWMSIRPGTDVALMLALAYHILANDWQDDAFLARFTSGWPQFRDYLNGVTDGQAKTPDWAAAITDVSAETIRDLAGRMVREHTMITVAWSLQRQIHGEQPVWCGLALAAMLGQIGQPGTGFGFGYGSMGPVGRPAQRIPWPSLPQGRNPIESHIPVARIGDALRNPGGTYAYRGDTRTYPDIRMIWWAGGNPYHHHQDLMALEDAWTRPETVIVQDHSWTATARRADIVLPSTSPLERHDIMMNPRDPTLIFMSPVTEPMGEAADDYDIFRRIGRRLDVEDDFTEGLTAEDWLSRLWSEAVQRGAAEGHALPDFETFRAKGRFDLPEGETTSIQFSAFVADPDAAPLQTETGRITIFNDTIAGFSLQDCPGHPAWLTPDEGLHNADEGWLHLISHQPNARLHAQNDRGPASLATKIKGREAAKLHPETALRHGLREGDIMRVHNARGACLAGVRISDTIRADCISLPTGAWFDPQLIDGEMLDVHGNPNVLTIDKGTSGLAQGNIAHTALVRITKWTKPLPDLTIDQPPEFVPAAEPEAG